MAQAPVRSFTILVVAAAAAASSAAWSAADLDDGIVQADTVQADRPEAVGPFDDTGRPPPCVDVAPPAQSNGPGASASEASGCL